MSSATRASRRAVTGPGPADEPSSTTGDAGRDGPVARAARRRGSGPLLLVVLALCLVAVAVVAAGIGAYRIPPGEVVGALLGRVGLGTEPAALAGDVLWQVRFPRVVLAALVGTCLGCAGAVMQGLFGNPLAEPGVVGVSAGAAVGAAAAIVTGLSAFGPLSIAAAAFVTGVLTTFGVYFGSRRDGRTEVVTLVLTGIAINAIAGAVLGLMLFLSDDAALRSITAWNLGSVANATWTSVGAVLPCALLGLVALARAVRPLDLLALGEGPAHHLGVDVERTRLWLIVVAALLTAAGVAVAGVISFVGLVVPHAVRMVAGPGHRIVLPASALGGAVVLVAADLAARTIAAPAEIPLGVLTALVGGPFFLWLLRRTRARHGGWG